MWFLVLCLALSLGGTALVFWNPTPRILNAFSASASALASPKIASKRTPYPSSTLRP
ncbi:KLK1 isoform 1 [Pan troglodytes]|uniref:Kallikrein 1 n=2 Tax=Homininae TaxID=207598 RepID=M0R318_HUMAN|nr:kallikrein 1 [Homo sapiens]KAI4044218.1 kallikrein 1 [Homo sapiens]PNI11213.1 KLK1 isoform 1 [Pan troglodytes]